MNKNPIYRSEEEAKDIACGNVAAELDENSQALDAINGAGWKQTIACTIAQGTLGCLVSYGLGNGGYCCTYTVECSKTCNK
ncbi:MAG: Lantibiotic lichenicidin VK21 A1 precursor [Firmicutes bacterium ADurb.BinA205]|nr:plantaricin C family lantibiotic [Ruminococcus sp.]OPZ22381.1 MAG: Lantibiotic lichenicidin VK21 A1 precursor [Firmicutes bacterium ADurb.BinA205]